MDSLKQRPESAFLFFLSCVRFPFAFFGTFLFSGIVMSFFTLVTFLKMRKLEEAIIGFWGRSHCWIAGLNVIYRGEENLPEGGCLFLFNHSSLFDIPIMYSCIDKKFRFGAKAELFKIPILGLTMRAMGGLPIHRGKREEVLKLYEQSVGRVHNGESFALAPEGTRQKVADIGKFKTGPFIFATKANCPVVPIVIKGALEILPNKSFLVNWGRYKRDVVLEVLPPLHPKDCDHDIEQLRDRTREAVVEAYACIENII